MSAAAHGTRLASRTFRQSTCRVAPSTPRQAFATGPQSNPSSSNSSCESYSGSSSSSSSSSFSSSSKTASLSYINIIIATASIVIGTPYALDLYSTLSGSKPASSSSSIPGKLEPYVHHPLALSSSNYYPDPGVASNHKLLQIALPPGIAATGTEDLSKRLRIRSIYIKEPSLVIERAYTPLYDTLPGSNSLAYQQSHAEGKGTLDIIVKRYADGELGRFLHRARSNPTVPQLEVRGPIDTWSLDRDSGGHIPDRIVMLVGGTGITPAYQLLTNLFGRPSAPAAQNAGIPKVEVLYAASDLDNALLLPELHALAHKNSQMVSVSLFAERLPSSPAPSAALGQLVAQRSQSGRSWIPFFGGSASSLDPMMQLTSPNAGSTNIPVYESRLTQQHLAKILAADETGKRTLVLVTGPDAMVEAIAGPKSRNGQTQGPLLGILAQLGLRQENVFKL